MKTNSGFIVLHRKILDWEWAKDMNTFVMFICLLLLANYEDGLFEGRVIKRGQLVTSLPNLSKITRQTIRQARTSLSHLKMTGEITDYSTNRYRVITIVNYDKYQTNDRQDDRQMTGKRQAKRQTNRQQYNNINNINKKNNNNSVVTATRFTPPTMDEIEEYCRESGIRINAERFIDYYTSNGWMVGKNHMKDWKATVRNWSRKNANETEQAEQLDVWGRPIRKEFV